MEKKRDLDGIGSQGKEAEMKARKGKQEQEAERKARKGSPWGVAGEEGSRKNRRKQGEKDPTRLFPPSSHLGK